MADLRAPLASSAQGEPASEPDVEAVDTAANTFGRLLRQTSSGIDGQRRTGLSMEWEGLSFSVGDKQILKGITGVLQPGRLTAVLGPSGSGKSTLLNILAGRQRTTGSAGTAPMTGEISVSGTTINVVDFKSSIAYVMQDDRLMATETPRECIEFSAYLRRQGTPEERAELVDTIDIWKRAYERACIERDQIEDHYKELLDMKDKQVQKMAEEYAEVKEEVQRAIDKGEQDLQECEDRWKRLQAQWGIEKADLEKSSQAALKDCQEEITRILFTELCGLLV